MSEPDHPAEPGHPARATEVVRPADPFRPGDVTWQRVDPALVRLKRLTVTLPLAVAALLPAAGAAAVIAWSGAPWVAGGLGTAAAVLALAALWSWRWARRHGASWGYAESEQDLLVTSGVLFRRLVTVPYGRMQYVETTAGPLERWLGIATVTLSTASRETAAHVPGLPPQEARRLRDRLVALGDVGEAGV